ncbi:MAG: YggS family pyridoxal phosphate-dependent enzyme [Lachnospiraceae bacterium]|nr:YggS family pyridoxal phosphate-dependent enzyme [Lachnospiraceae bacterium]
MDLRQNLEAVKQKIKNACEGAKREPSEVTLIAVSKTKPAEMIEEFYALGVRDFGENKVQELVDKYERLPKDIRWHLIGHLQTNKVKYVVDKAYMIHSVDSLRLAREISKEAVKKGVCVKILIEVNVAGEESKFGVKPSETEKLIRQIAALPGISICGLMTVAPYVADGEENSTIFCSLRELSIDINAKNIDNVSMGILSMGMSGDYETAIRWGAVYVRVGTALFGERDYGI